MKNKMLTYLLGLIVLAVWGLIIYRVFYAVSGDDDDDSPAVLSKAVKEPYNDFNIPKDTTRLLLNYRDPFGLVSFKDTTATTVKISHHKVAVPSPLKPGLDWNFIQYSGYIQNPGSKKLLALVTINGKNEMLSEGEIKDNVKLLKNMRDAIKVSFNGQTKIISIKSPAL